MLQAWRGPGLLNFVLPMIFDDAFLKHNIIGVDSGNALMSKLQLVLRPFVLRRQMVDVERNQDETVRTCPSRRRRPSQPIY